MKGKKMREKEYDVKFKVVTENVITIKSKSKKEAMEKAQELLNTDFKKLDIKNYTKHYYLVILDNKNFLRKDVTEVEE